MIRRLLVSFAICAVAATGLAIAEDVAEVKAPEALAPFKRALKQALGEGMSQGPVQAVGACNLEAPGIAAAHSQQGTKVGRASHRLRNPANAPPDWVKPILDAYLEDASDRAPRATTLPGGASGYVEPILVQPLCLTCHGKAIAPDVAARIAELYPDDAAVGLDEGELRGVWWVETPAAN